MSDTPLSRGSRAAPSAVVIGDPAPLADRADNRVLIPVIEGAPPRPPSDLIRSLDGQTMGTTWSARVIAPPGVGEATVREAIEEELAAVVALFSPWEPSSEISRFNTAPAGVWAVSQPFWDLLDAAMTLGDETNGAVDPTLGALVDLWGFGPPGPRPALLPLPPEEEIAAALAVSGWQKLRLNPDARGVMQMGGMKLDFSGIAKGHAVDRVSDRLTALGATSHLIEIGGELKGRGVKPDAQPWWVEIERVENSPAPRTVAALFDLAVATSGDYRRAFVHDGRLYPHTLDGSTGRPVRNALSSVTVIHASAMMADAYATALTVMGPFEGPEYAEALGLAAHFVERSERGPIERMTPAFAAMMDDPDGDRPG
ncbi:Thiamine biosynthesis lipoprotein ApbE precursor [Brevundimonas sp. SH203]|uniref:FAD:protein FMN transferase n=1 Tax=Brevundimonas sp. SH203 TaxID=345167 RepID=UPI0009CB377A|nr:FAD:protein FMN transferase [Brevundimonas sp. SH203]GAW42234.1 Thiamine biosynthesis lipoprotein ApbE precursor [Brevundimonas sp. SH203]